MSTRQRGFTLIELMIVVVIVAILASIAYPSYTQFVRRSARADAKSALMENAQFMERNFTTANSYAVDSASNPITSASLPVQQSPRNGAAKYTVTVTVDAATPGQFLLRAAPVTADDCGTFTLNQQGQKALESATLSVAECWNR